MITLLFFKYNLSILNIIYDTKSSHGLTNFFKFNSNIKILFTYPILLKYNFSFKLKITNKPRQEPSMLCYQNFYSIFMNYKGINKFNLITLY